MTKTSDDRERALLQAIQAIERQYGKGAIMRLGEEAVVQPADVIPTGSIGLDIAIGVGGIPRGRVVEIFGPESSGKTTLALHIISQAQKLGGKALFIDAEHAVNPLYARRIGVDVGQLYIHQPDSGEQALDVAESMVRSNSIDVVVVDSVAALVPRAEIEGDMGDAHVGLQARLMSQALRKLTGAISKTSAIVVFINQIRMKIGIMFGSPETTSGGNALKFYASLRLDIRRIGSIKQGEEIVGNRTKVTVVKNKVAPPFKSAEFDLMYDHGISKEGEIVDLGVEAGKIEKSGAWFSYKDDRIGQGRENAKAFLVEHPDICSKIEAELRQAHFVSRVKEPAGDNAEGGAE